MIAFWATGAMAHSPIDDTIPAHEAVISQVPSEVVLSFLHDIRLTRLTMTHADHPAADLDLSGYKGMTTEYSVPMQPMGNGTYVIDWRGLGADGHAMNGTFSFTVE